MVPVCWLVHNTSASFRGGARAATYEPCAWRGKYGTLEAPHRSTPSTRSTAAAQHSTSYLCCYRPAPRSTQSAPASASVNNAGPVHGGTARQLAAAGGCRRWSCRRCMRWPGSGWGASLPACLGGPAYPTPRSGQACPRLASEQHPGRLVEEPTAESLPQPWSATRTPLRLGAWSALRWKILSLTAGFIASGLSTTSQPSSDPMAQVPHG